MNYLSFTPYSGWRKKLKPTWQRSRNDQKKRYTNIKQTKETQRQSERLEGNLRLGIQNRLFLFCLLLSSLSCKKLQSLPQLIFFFCVFFFFGCVAVKLSVCSPCGENIENRGSTVPPRAPHAVTQAVFLPTHKSYLCFETEFQLASFLWSHYQETQRQSVCPESYYQHSRCSSTQCCLSLLWVSPPLQDDCHLREEENIFMADCQISQIPTGPEVASLVLFGLKR